MILSFAYGSDKLGDPPSFLGDNVGSGNDDEAVLTEQRSRLQRMREHGAAGADSAPSVGNREIVATSSDGAVYVLIRERRLVAVEIARGVLRRARSDVSGALRETINQALERALTESPQVGDPAPNLAAIGAQLAAVAHESREQLRKIQGAVEGNMARLAGKARSSGDASPHYVDFVLSDALELVQSMQSALADNSAESASGSARDESDEVEAVVSEGKVTDLLVTSTALQMPVEELGFAITETVNDALAEWERRSATSADPEMDVEMLRKLGERAGAIREQSMQHLRNYADSMTSIMRNLD